MSHKTTMKSGVHHKTDKKCFSDILPRQVRLIKRMEVGLYDEVILKYFGK